jgi:hypothetical protein
VEASSGYCLKKTPLLFILCSSPKTCPITAPEGCKKAKEASIEFRLTVFGSGPPFEALGQQILRPALKALAEWI